jgi:hypothetical protein
MELPPLSALAAVSDVSSRAKATGVLSCFVRDDRITPPLVLVLGPLVGWPLVVIGVGLSFASFLMWLTPAFAWPWGILLHMGLASFLLAMDGMWSNALGRNIELIRTHGYTDAAILSIMLFNWCSSQALVIYIVLTYCYAEEPDALTLLASSDLAVWAWRAFALLINLGLTELTFFVAHRELHQNATLAPFHVIHHCCLRSSSTANLLFHPVDLSLEFSGPVLMLGLSHAFLFQDRAILLISIFTVQLWYAVDHDETVKLPHFFHHRTVNNNFAIYWSVFDTARPDRVKPLLYVPVVNKKLEHHGSGTADRLKLRRSRSRSRSISR